MFFEEIGFTKDVIKTKSITLVKEKDFKNSKKSKLSIKNIAIEIK
jgi:hypothetical protein